MEAETTIPLRNRSAKGEWKSLLMGSVVSTLFAIGLILVFARNDWIGHFGKEKIEIHALPFLLSAVFLGVIWAIRSTRNFLRCGDATPMAQADYFLLREISFDDPTSPFPTDRLTRWTWAVLFASGGSALQAAPDAVDSIKVSLVTFWLPSVLYLSAAIYAIDVTLFCLALAAIGGVLWGLSVLSIPFAIVLVASIIAFAIYWRKKH